MCEKVPTLGAWGETLARSYLEENGYRIIEQNYRTRYAEIDLIACKRRVLAFIEVRTRKQTRFGIPEESLTFRKISRLIKSATAYAAQKNYRGVCRIDALCIVVNKKGYPERITHHYNITQLHKKVSLGYK